MSGFEEEEAKANMDPIHQITTQTARVRNNHMKSPSTSYIPTTKIVVHHPLNFIYVAL